MKADAGVLIYNPPHVAAAARRERLVLWGLLPAALAVSASCSPTVDLKQTLQVTDVAGGWHDAGIVDGKNKLVPSLSFRVRKPADVRLQSLSLNIIFKRVSADKKRKRIWTRSSCRRWSSPEDSPTPLLTVGGTRLCRRRRRRAEILQHSQFRDARAVVLPTKARRRGSTCCATTSLASCCLNQPK